MKDMKQVSRSWTLVGTLLAGILALTVICPMPTTPPATPSVVMETLDRSFIPYSTLWQKEIERRFTNAVGVIVHGADFVEGQWSVGTNLAHGRRVTPVQEVVRHYQALYPDRTLVLISCNPGHLKLGIPGVWYSKSNVWCIPDRGLKPEHFSEMGGTFSDPYRVILGSSRWEDDPNTVGSIFEFVSE